MVRVRRRVAGTTTSAVDADCRQGVESMLAMGSDKIDAI